MLNRAVVVSKNDLGRWKNPRVRHDTALHDIDPLGSGGFQLHECGVWPDSADWNYDGLCNPFWRFYYNAPQGSAVIVDGRRRELSPDEVLVIPENTLFHSRGAAGVTHQWVHFSPPLSLGLSHEVSVLPLTPAVASCLEGIRELLLQNAEQTAAGKTQIYHLCLGLLHAWIAEGPPRTQRAFPPALGLVLDRIERSVAGDLSNTVLADHAAMSLEAFIRWFRDWTGMTPARYVARRRIREASRLLILSEASIDEIAEATGFANRHHFSRVFLRHTGRSPARFRREERR